MIPKWRPDDALYRAKRRQSPWRIIAVPIGFACAIGVYLVAHSLTLKAQIWFGPDRVFFCTPTHLSAIVLFLVLAVLSIPIGLIIANLLLWIAPPIRAALDRADMQAGGSFATANAQLVKFALVSAVVCLPGYLTAVGSKVCLSGSKIYHQSHVFAPLQTYDMSQITEVRPRCTKDGRGGWDFGIDIVLSESTSFDLAIVGPWFSAWSERILASLSGIRLSDSYIESGCPMGIRKLITP